MAGVKRPRAGSKLDADAKSDSPYIPMFENFRAELDEHHDRRERVIKASRDITAQSKKIIFALQRAQELGKPIGSFITHQTDGMQKVIDDLFNYYTVSEDLQGINAFRYQRNISGGIQEYMEAILFRHYLETQRLLTHEEAAQKLTVMLTYEDYVLGLFDMTGELMRFAITYMATHGSLPGSDGKGSSNILSDMREIRSQLELVNVSGSFGLSREFDKKLSVTKSSTEKVEKSVYSMIVRGSERPKGWRPDVEAATEREEVES